MKNGYSSIGMTRATAKNMQTINRKMENPIDELYRRYLANGYISPEDVEELKKKYIDGPNWTQTTT